MGSLSKENIYLIGVGGIGMSALARYFVQIGKQVAGYDRATTPLTKRLQAEGVRVTDFDEADAIPFPHREKENTLVIYTPAIPLDNSIREYFEEEGFEMMKRAEVLGLISQALRTIAISGTHGKTTISAMVSYLLDKNDVSINSFLGGISTDYGSNLILNQAADWMVTEADEFDRSFLQLKPELAVISSIDTDHLDIYENEEDLHDTYRKFAAQINANGSLFTKSYIKEKLGLHINAGVKTYGLNDPQADYSAETIRVENGSYLFNWRAGEIVHENFSCGLAGLHNVENATVALAIAHQLGVGIDQLKISLKEFSGVKRRFDVHIKNSDLVYIDDYAHHPEEIKMLMRSVKELYPNRKVTSIFQPHLYSRTQDLGDEFAAALNESDELILLELYPAREEPIEGIDSRWLSRKIQKENVPVCQKSQLMNILKERELDVLLTIGAGDIDQMIEPIIDYYAG